MRKRMRDRRKELGLYQHEVAKLAGMTRANYAHIERGRHEPNLEQMTSIARALKVKAEANFFEDVCDKMDHSTTA